MWCCRAGAAETGDRSGQGRCHDQGGFPGRERNLRAAADRTTRPCGQCSATRNAPPKAVADAIQEREKATIEYPADGNLIGDWKKGEALAQSGYGLRFTDYPPARANGGNCYACHQLTKKELSYGTLGPSLPNTASCETTRKPT